MKKLKNPWLGLESKGYNCFGCAPGNPYGLKMEFYEDGDDIVCLWTAGNNYQGWLDTLHGGIQATLMDEIAAWVIARKLQTTGMTTAMNVKYRTPITTGENEQIQVRAHIREIKRNFAFIEVVIIYKNKVCSEAELTFFCFSKEKAEKEFFFAGCNTDDDTDNKQTVDNHDLPTENDI